MGDISIAVSFFGFGMTAGLLIMGIIATSTVRLLELKVRMNELVSENLVIEIRDRYGTEVSDEIIQCIRDRPCKIVEQALEERQNDTIQG